MENFGCICYFSITLFHIIHSLLMVGITGGWIGEHTVLDMLAFPEQRDRQWTGWNRWIILIEDNSQGGTDRKESLSSSYGGYCHSKEKCSSYVKNLCTLVLVDTQIGVSQDTKPYLHFCGLLHCNSHFIIFNTHDFQGFILHVCDLYILHTHFVAKFMPTSVPSSIYCI